MMPRLAACLIAILIAAPAAAQPFADAALAEARQSLIPCQTLPAVDREKCSNRQGIFLDNYILGWGGDGASARIVANALGYTGENGGASIHPGIRHDRVKACVWLHYTTVLVSDAAEKAGTNAAFDRYCRILEAGVVVRIVGRAIQMVDANTAFLEASTKFAKASKRP